MHCEDVSPQGGAVAAAVGAVGARVRAFPSVGENVLLQVVFAGAAREHLATYAALHRHLLTTPTTLQSKHTHPQLSISLPLLLSAPLRPAKVWLTPSPSPLPHKAVMIRWAIETNCWGYRSQGY